MKRQLRVNQEYQEKNINQNKGFKNYEKTSALREKYKQLKEQALKEAIKESKKEQEDKEHKVTEKEFKIYHFLYKFAKNIINYCLIDNVPLLMFFILDLFCLSQVDFEDSTEDEQQEQYNTAYSSFFSSFTNLISNKELNTEDIILEFIKEK